MQATGEMLHYFERSWTKAQDVIAAISPADLDREFSMREELRPGGATTRVTIRHRVVEQFGRHLAEHESQLRETFARWTIARAGARRLDQA